MIKISRLEGGLIHLHKEECKLGEPVLKAIKDVYLKAKKKNVEIEYQELDSVQIRIDKRWTAEAVFNLLDNAVKYGPDGGKIKVVIQQLGLFAVIKVSDSATAISEEEKTKIFKRFYRGKNSKNQEGVGLGLYLAREIVLLEGGYMNLISTEEGNTFSMFLQVNQ